MPILIINNNTDNILNVIVKYINIYLLSIVIFIDISKYFDNDRVYEYLIRNKGIVIIYILSGLYKLVKYNRKIKRNSKVSI